MVSLPRLVIAAPASGHGKTTVATGLMAALRRAGHTVSGHKVGPDYIDPGYHSLATGRPGRNLDPHLVGEERLVPLLLHGAEGADIAIVEGVMGLYDGQIGGDGFASTAHVATVTRTPVVLVVDVSHASRSIAAVVHGMVAVRPVGAHRRRHPQQGRLPAPCRRGVPCAGAHRACRCWECCIATTASSPPRDTSDSCPPPSATTPPHALDRLADRIARAVDLEQIVRLAQQAPDLDDVPGSAGPEPSTAIAEAGGRRRRRTRVHVPLRRDHRAARSRWVRRRHVRPARRRVPPRWHGRPLPRRRLPRGPRRRAVGQRTPAGRSCSTPCTSGVPTVAECAGLLYLCRSVDGAPMVGAIDAEARMTPKLTLAYRTVDTRRGPSARRRRHPDHRPRVPPRPSSSPPTR